MHNTLKDKAVFGALLLCIYVVFDLMVMVSDESGIPNQSRNFFYFEVPKYCFQVWQKMKKSIVQNSRALAFKTQNQHLD